MINEFFWKVHTSSVLRFVQVSSGGITRPAIEREEEAQGWWGGWSQRPNGILTTFWDLGPSKMWSKDDWLKFNIFWGFGGGNAIVHPRWSAGLDRIRPRFAGARKPTTSIPTSTATTTCQRGTWNCHRDMDQLINFTAWLFRRIPSICMKLYHESCMA